MDTFKRSGAAVKNLRINRRSHPDLVSFQNRFFKRVMQENTEGQFFRSVYGEDVESIPYEIDTNSSRVRIIGSETSDDSKGVAKTIRALLEEEIVFRNKSGGCLKRQITPGDIAILLRTFSRVTSYEAALEEMNIPFYTVGSRNFYERPEVTGPLSWLDLLVDPLNDNNLASFLLSPAFGATLDEMLL
jgi:ATP-dependent exoDNAse (exonuclease V) beta subunit